ncbi:hypothetical protein AX16_006319 [Volvariella volvacea WC 439]|nr:hypothetical protein AX16_006319 [Volvariella volvacea WC 439]
MPPNRNNYHGPKRQLLGNNAGHVAPAWRTGSIPGYSAGPAAQHQQRSQQQQGSKIFLSRLPMDVGEAEVEELFRKTVGPVSEAFLVYNNQGHSKGMAVVHFTRPGDALLARQKYDGKIVDGRRPIKIEIIHDGVPPKPQPQSLLARLAPPPPLPISEPVIPDLPVIKTTQSTKSRHNKAAAVATATTQNASLSARSVTTTATTTTTTTRPVFLANGSGGGGKKVRVKKGPKRVNKKKLIQAHKSKEQLDMEMEEYNAQREADEI